MDGTTDRLVAYRLGMAGRRSGAAAEACPLEAGVSADAWVEGWWDEEAYTAQREVLIVVQGEAASYRSALQEVLRFLPEAVFVVVLARVTAARARVEKILHGDRAA